MKTENTIRSLVKYSTFSALALSSPLFAIERPTPAVQPEEKIAPAVPAEDAQQAIPMPEVNVQKIAFLGVFGEPISDTLSAHLNLAGGIGIELKVVAGNSPASKAGLQKHDIITSLAGNDISSLEDLQAAIADKNPGDEVTLNYISKGKAVSKKLTLGARPTPGTGWPRAGQMPRRNKQLQAELGAPGLPKEFLNKFPEKDREKLMQLFKGKLEGLDLQELQQGMGKLEGFDLNLLPKGLNPEMNKGLKFKGGFRSRVKMLDQHGSITLESTKDGKVIELLDKKGKLEYRGPYNNEADKKSVPEDLRDRVENLDIGNGLGLLGVPNMENLGGNKMKLQFKDLKRFKEMQKNLRKGNEKNTFQFKIDRNSVSSTRTDPQTGNLYTFKKEGKQSQVEVCDPAGKPLYDGPYNSDADKASVPNEYRDFLKKLDSEIPLKKGNKIELKLGQ